MRKDWKYVLYVSSAILLFVVVKMLAPKKFDWTVTLSHRDKNPYGTYALNSLLPGILGNGVVRNSNQTMYELEDSLDADDNLMVLCTSFNPGEADAEALLRHVARGGSAFISSQGFWGQFADTLGISASDVIFSGRGGLADSDTTYLRFAGEAFDTTQYFPYRRDNIFSFFDDVDSANCTVIARNSYGEPVTIRVPWGKGQFILNSTPLAFTNIYLLSADNHNFISGMLSYLEPRDMQWTEFYMLGRNESATPLRFILSNEPLRWAYYITVLSILAFMIFEARRKQRVIPVIRPLPNTTLEFVSTIGNLYYATGNHHNIAEKKIHFLLDQIRTKYWMNTSTLDETFVRTLAAKTGKPESEIMALFDTVNYVLRSSHISGDVLADLNEKIEKFNR